MRGTIWKYYLFTFFVNLRFFSAILVPFFTQEAGLNLFQIQILQSWYMLWIFLLEVPTGLISDYFGRKYSLGLGAIFLTLAIAIFTLEPSYAFFFLAEALYALSIALMSGSDKAYLYDALDEEGKLHESKSNFGKSNSVALIGFLISGTLSGFIASSFGLKAPMILSVVPFMIAAVVILTSREPKKNKKGTRLTYHKILKEGVSYLYNHKILRVLAADAIIVSATAYFVFWLYPSLLKMLNVPLAYYGLVYVLLIGAQILVSINFTKLEKLFGSGRRFFQFGALVTGISFILAGLFPNPVTVLLFIIFAGGFGISRFELMNAYMNNNIASLERATILSFISMVRRTVLIFLNIFVGYFATKSLPITLIVLGCLSFIALFISKEEHFV